MNFKLHRGLALAAAISVAACSGSGNALPVGSNGIQSQSITLESCPTITGTTSARCFALMRTDVGGALPNGYHGTYAPSKPMPLAISKTMTTPTSTSPALVTVPPMAQTPIQSPASMAASNDRSKQSAIQSPNWTLLSGSATDVTAAADGSIWALSTDPSGADKYIWHYVAGTWSNISGQATQLAVTPDGTLYCINSSGNIYVYSGGSWSSIGGSASAITAAADNTIYVVSTGGGDEAIWHYSGGSWTQMAGSGVTIAGSDDLRSHTLSGGTIAPNGFYILNSSGGIYYENADTSVVSISGSAAGIAPTTSGGIFVLGYPSSSSGTTIYYNDLDSPGWTSTTGSGIRISANSEHLYVVSSSNNIYASPVVPSALGSPSGFDPLSLQSAYALPSSTAGSGQTVGIVDAYDDPTAESDLAVYRSQFGLPACTTSNGCFSKVNETGGTTMPASNSGWAQEISLDLDMASAICPKCHILLVEANDNSYGNLGTSVNTAVTLGATTVSNSYGGGEFSGETSYDTYYYHPGHAITASTGDLGYGVQFPAASPYVTAVGGTSLSRASNARGWTETAWSGAGSGCSAYESKPSWQSDTSCSRRTVADVSAVADPNTGVAVYDSTPNGGAYGWLVFGGTSVASPIIASVYALAGNASSVTFGSYPYSHTSFLFDITSGSNGSCGTYLCNAGTAYDGPTGLGTPNGTLAF